MKHYKLASEFYKQKGQKHNESLWAIRQKRDKAIKEVDEWEELRQKASDIKDNVINNLQKYIDEFIENAKNNNIEVHFAKTDKDHNKIVYSYLKNAKKVVKSKSMLTEECGLNEYLYTKGIEVIDTDLGERIVQLRGEKPSHIVLPAIHTTKEDVAEILNETNTDPTYLTHKMREILRGEFLSADAGISGANFLVANKGYAVVCTNEGNADLGASVPPLHIISVGVDKIVPNMQDLGVFLRMLARNATGQKITTYTSIFGKSEKKRVIILVDNGRLDRINSEFRDTLKCIRCSACLTTCPVFRRGGGHSYRYIIPGPIGSLLAPLKDKEEYKDLPFACTLCNSCEMVCPVKIPFSKQLINMRKYVTKPNPISKVAENILNNPSYYKLFSKILHLTPQWIFDAIPNEWSKYKSIPRIPR
ncbi:MAG: lactate utilization protein [Epsilonproteobacteria bacterium]|nr:lactate utilization protein [Campylobacterota bacterium]